MFLKVKKKGPYYSVEIRQNDNIEEKDPYSIQTKGNSIKN